LKGQLSKLIIASADADGGVKKWLLFFVANFYFCSARMIFAF
jgi:hypothetical protein